MKKIKLVPDKIKICLYIDNQNAIRLIKNPEFPKRSKPIDVIRQKYEEKMFEIHYISTNR